MARHLITSALPYINGVKHLGNLIGSMLPADVYARALRQQGHDVLFICATDEHGTPAELAAIAAGVPVARYCEEQHIIQKNLGERFELSWDHFGRSSSKENHELTQHFAERLERGGYIEERDTNQLYSPSEDRFLPDRYIVGTCPRCGYERARGDQCESCGALLEATELKDARSAVTGAVDLETRNSRHLYLRQSVFEGRLRAWLAEHSDWPVLTTSIAKKWLDEGLRDRCITRDLSWGVPVPRPGYEHKVFYVWFDAPIEYIAATYEWANANTEEGRDWRSWWFDAGDVEYAQFMAKDNIPFHTLSFPCTLLGSSEPWTMATYIKGFNWLTYYGDKFSTSDSRGVFMDDALELLSADYWRWHLIANAPESADAAFTWEGLGESVNKDLADKLGNFVNRSLTFAHRHFGDTVPARAGDLDAKLVGELDEELVAYTYALNNMEFRKAAQRLRSIWSIGNQYLDRTKPWSIVDDDPVAAKTVMNCAINLVHAFAVVSAPIIPATSAIMLRALNMDQQELRWCTDASTALTEVPAGHRFEVPPMLFQKLDDQQLTEWKSRFSGSDQP